MFTIEAHLEELSRINDNCKTIFSIWNLNKKNLKAALSTIPLTFPHYSIHDYSHADTIIQNIELFLGEDRIRLLTATDAWLLLMAAYSHDIGMIVYMKDIEQKINSGEFDSELSIQSKNKRDIDLAESADLILNLIQRNKSIQSNSSLEKNGAAYALKIKKAITLLSAELFRKIHHKRSRDIIKKIDENLYSEFNKFYSNDIPARFLQTLGDISYSHGVDFYEAMNFLPLKSNGYASDYMHPRFVACMLRLGDLLDVDDKRFNQFTSNVFSQEKVKISAKHEKKHASVNHLLVTPDGIEVSVDCKEDEDVFRIANQWFDWLKKEVELQNREWHKIRPSYLSGLAPTISRDKVQVLFNGKEADPDLMNLQFHISREKTFEIFEGNALYDNPTFVFLREISQNAVDATKIQLWKDVEKGVYDSLIRTHLNKVLKIECNEWEHSELIDAIEYPSDIPKEVYANYGILLNIDWHDEAKNIFEITIADRGLGINKNTLLRICNNVGDSRKNDQEFLELKERLPFFLKPTGAFGLGLQSIFLVADEFEMKTKNEDDQGWHILFRSAKNGEYINARPLDSRVNNGSILNIKVNKKIIPHIESSEIREIYDDFLDEKGGPYAYHIILFAKKYLLKQQFLSLKVLGEKITDDKYNSKNESKQVREVGNWRLVENKRHVDKRLLSSIGVFRETDTVNKVRFVFFEYLTKSTGTKISVEFSDEFSDGFYGFGSRDYISFSVRGIQIDEKRHYNFCSYSWLNIDFLNPESDKILNIARNKFIQKSLIDFFRIFHESIWPLILQDAKLLLDQNFDELKGEYNVNEDYLNIIYFHLQLSFLLHPQLTSLFENQASRDFILPEYIVSIYESNDLGRSIGISSSQFFIHNSYILNECSQSDIGYVLGVEDDHDFFPSFSMIKKSFVIINKDRHPSGLPIIWQPSELSQYLRMYFVLKSIQYFEDKNVWDSSVVIKREPEKYHVVELDEKHLSKYLKRVFKDGYVTSGRRVMYPIVPYAEDLAVKVTDDVHGLNYLSYANHLIISPFSSNNQLYKISRELSELIRDVNKDEIKRILRDQYIDELITEKLISHIIKNRSLLGLARSVRTIKEKYVELILDILLAMGVIDYDEDNVF